MLQKLKKWAIILMSGFILMGCSSKDKVAIDTKVDNIVETSEEEALDTKEGDIEKTKEEKVLDIKDDNIVELKGEVVLETNLDEDDGNIFEKANGWTNGYMFDCTWRADNVSFVDGVMKLTIDTDGENVTPKWSGGEYRTRKFYSYGMYEVKMKPIKNDGVVSSFFTYTGPSDNNPWDEIDIEFLGKDTTKIQLNYFTNSIGNHEYTYDLGFDASEEFHTYGFEWLPESITWYVDGEPIYTATENIPSTPSKLMMNVWPGIGVDGWLNAYDGTVPLSAEYDWFRVTQYNIENQ